MFLAIKADGRLFALMIVPNVIFYDQDVNYTRIPDAKPWAKPALGPRVNFSLSFLFVALNFCEYFKYIFRIKKFKN